MCAHRHPRQRENGLFQYLRKHRWWNIGNEADRRAASTRFFARKMTLLRPSAETIGRVSEQLFDVFEMVRDYVPGAITSRTFCIDLARRFLATRCVTSMSTHSAAELYLQCGRDDDDRMTRTRQFSYLTILQSLPITDIGFCLGSGIAASELLEKLGGNYTWQSRVRASINLSRYTMIFGPNQFAHVRFEGRNYYLFGERHRFYDELSFRSVGSATVMQFINDIITLKQDEAFDLFVENADFEEVAPEDDIAVYHAMTPTALYWFPLHFDVLNDEKCRYDTQILPNCRFHSLDVRRGAAEPVVAEGFATGSIPYPRDRFIKRTGNDSIAHHDKLGEFMDTTFQYEARELPEPLRERLVAFAHEHYAECVDRAGTLVEDRLTRERRQMAVLTDYYALARMFRKFPGNEDGNVIAYAGAWHIMTYMDFFRYIGAEVVTSFGFHFERQYLTIPQLIVAHDGLPSPPPGVLRELLHTSFGIREYQLAFEHRETVETWFKFLFCPPARAQLEDEDMWHGKTPDELFALCFKHIRDMNENPDVQRELLMRLGYMLKVYGTLRGKPYTGFLEMLAGAFLHCSKSLYIHPIVRRMRMRSCARSQPPLLNSARPLRRLACSRRSRLSLSLLSRLTFSRCTCGLSCRCTCDLGFFAKVSRFLCSRWAIMVSCARDNSLLMVAFTQLVRRWVVIAMAVRDVSFHTPWPDVGYTFAAVPTRVGRRESFGAKDV